jgi:hypothetical protein
MVHTFCYYNYLGGFNVMIITTLPLKEMNQRKNITFEMKDNLILWLAM